MTRHELTSFKELIQFRSSDNQKLALAQLDDLIEAVDDMETVITKDGWFLVDIKEGDSPDDIANKITEQLRNRYQL